MRAHARVLDSELRARKVTTVFRVGGEALKCAQKTNEWRKQRNAEFRRRERGTKGNEEYKKSRGRKGVRE